MGKLQVAGAFLEPTGGVLSCAYCQHMTPRQTGLNYWLIVSSPVSQMVTNRKSLKLHHLCPPV